MDSIVSRLPGVALACLITYLASLVPWQRLLARVVGGALGGAGVAKDVDLDTFCDRPFILPARISHTRFAPSAHRFAYSYLVVGVPVVKGGYSTPLVSLDPQPWHRRRWLQVEARDHLGRTVDNSSLHAKLQGFLAEHGLDPDDFPHCYLVTPPRFLNYYNSPASFWYLYSRERKLTAMIAEVNNTFDERRNYLLHNGPAARTASPVHRRDLPGRVEFAWAKDFHVSCFNARKGSYSLRSLDPLAQPGAGAGAVDVTATVVDNKGKARMVARLRSVGLPVDPRDMSVFRKAAFLTSWCWVGLATYPRVLYEAARLTFLRGLLVFFHPEPNQYTVSRQSTTEEGIIEHSFRRYLEHAVQTSATPITLHYTASEETRLNPTRTETFSSPAVEGGARREISLTVNSPAFYSRLVEYEHIDEAIRREMLQDDERNRTATTSDAAALSELLQSHSSQQEPHQDDTPSDHPAPASNVLWSLTRHLRTSPTPLEYPTAGPVLYPDPRALLSSPASKDAERRDGATTPTDAPEGDTHTELSDLDSFVAASETPGEQAVYRRALNRVYLQERIGRAGDAVMTLGVSGPAVAAGLAVQAVAGATSDNLLGAAVLGAATAATAASTLSALV